MDSSDKESRNFIQMEKQKQAEKAEQLAAGGYSSRVSTGGQSQKGVKYVDSYFILTIA